MAIPQEASDRLWPEVERTINTHAINMRIAFLGVKGLGVVVMTWTTVVLLGGFVSVLQKKDFWSLTAITLFELAGTFDFILADRVGGYILSPFRIASATYARIIARGYPLPGKVGAFGSLGIDLLVNCVKKCIEVVLFVLGLYISTLTSLWRLIVHDYGKADGGANLKPALDVLYSLAVVQGALFLYMNCYSLLASKMAVRQVGRRYKLDQTNLLVSSYLEETVAGCKLDSTFIKGRNLVTYAVDLLMESKSPARYTKVIKDIREMLEASLGTEREVMVKQLLIDSVSFGHIVRRLLRTMHPRGRYSSEARENAAGIMMFLVDEVRLEQFPGGIQSITSLLNTSEEYIWLPKGYKREVAHGLAEVSDQGDWLLELQQRYNVHKNYELSQQEVLKPFDKFVSVYTKMFLYGLGILRWLADDEDNCRVISNNEGLLSMITAPLISSRLHQDHPAEWTSLSAQSLALLCRFMTTPGETGVKLRRQISSNGEAIIRTLQNFLECDECFNEKVLPGITVQILLDLSVDTSTIMACEKCSTRFITVLLHIFLQKYSSDELESFLYLCDNMYWLKKQSYIRNWAAEKLVRFSSQSERSATVILRAGGESNPALSDLTDTFVGAKNNTYRMRAAEILEHLCGSYTNDDSYLKSLKEAILNAVPKVLTEILRCGSTEACRQAETEATQPRYSSTDADIEDGPGSPDNGQRHRHIHSSHHKNGEENGDNKLHEALLSLCATVCLKWISTDPDLARRFDEIASKICSERGKPVKAFTLLVEEAMEILKKKND